MRTPSVFLRCRFVLEWSFASSALTGQGPAYDRPFGPHCPSLVLTAATRVNPAQGQPLFPDGLPELCSRTCTTALSLCCTGLMVFIVKLTGVTLVNELHGFQVHNSAGRRLVCRSVGSPPGVSAPSITMFLSPLPLLPPPPALPSGHH